MKIETKIIMTDMWLYNDYDSFYIFLYLIGRTHKVHLSNNIHIKDVVCVSWLPFNNVYL